jgi:hypothetical protein
MESPSSGWVIRQARPDEYAALGKLLVSAYAGLPGMPTPEQQPEYYAMLADMAARAARPSLSVFVATGGSGELLGSIDFIDDMTQYGSGGTAGTITDAAGIRLLAIDPATRSRQIADAILHRKSAQCWQGLGRASHHQNHAGRMDDV